MASTGISKPYLYFHEAASYRARCTCHLESAMNIVDVRSLSTTVSVLTDHTGHQTADGRRNGIEMADR
jgi:hypothetical protein